MNPVSKPALQFCVGDVINQSYRLQRHVALGGFAEIWQAEHVRTADVVAVKLLRAGGGQQPNLALRMAREVQILSELRHPNCVQYKGHDEVASRVGAEGQQLPCPVATPFIVLEWVDGLSLGSLMRRRMRQGAIQGGAISLAEASRWFGQVVAVVAEAHRLGILHRDITPGNVFIRKNGRVVLLDWNLGVSRQSRDITVFNNPHGAGTPFYAAPEQAESLASANETADIYSLAVVMVKALTGCSLKRLCSGEQGAKLDVDLVRKALTLRGGGVLPPVAEPLVELLLRALADNPASRPQAVSAFLPAFEQAAAEDQTAVLPPRDLNPARRPSLPAPPAGALAVAISNGSEGPKPSDHSLARTLLWKPLAGPDWAVDEWKAGGWPVRAWVAGGWSSLRTGGRSGTSALLGAVVVGSALTALVLKLWS